MKLLFVIAGTGLLSLGTIFYSDPTKKLNNSNERGGNWGTYYTCCVEQTGYCYSDYCDSISGGCDFAASDCQNTGGTYSSGSTATPCAECGVGPEGACCTNQTCISSGEKDCYLFGGQWLGEDTDCFSDSCPTACLGDLNSDGTVNVTDILINVSVYGDCP